jgi:hypothetical protein
MSEAVEITSFKLGRGRVLERLADPGSCVHNNQVCFFNFPSTVAKEDQRLPDSSAMSRS